MVKLVEETTYEGQHPIAVSSARMGNCGTKLVTEFDTERTVVGPVARHADQYPDGQISPGE